MARRGRKRRLDIESEYWLLLASVGTVEAGRPVGIVRKSGSCATGCSSLRRSAGSAVRGFPSSRFVRNDRSGPRIRGISTSSGHRGGACSFVIVTSGAFADRRRMLGGHIEAGPGAPLYRSEWSWGDMRGSAPWWALATGGQLRRSAIGLRRDSHQCPFGEGRHRLCPRFGWAFGSDSTTADPLGGVVVHPGLLDLAQIDRPLGECREQRRKAAPVH
jgi:hypothetical protein